MHDKRHVTEIDFFKMRLIGVSSSQHFLYKLHKLYLYLYLFTSTQAMSSTKLENYVFQNLPMATTLLVTSHH